MLPGSLYLLQTSVATPRETPFWETNDISEQRPTPYVENYFFDLSCCMADVAGQLETCVFRKSLIISRYSCRGNTDPLHCRSLEFKEEIASWYYINFMNNLNEHEDITSANESFKIDGNFENRCICVSVCVASCFAFFGFRFIVF
jgi:hypothetical protein